MITIDLNTNNVILMLGETNAFYIKVNEHYYPTKHNDVSQYHTMLWLKDKEYRTKVANVILQEWFYDFK